MITTIKEFTNNLKKYDENELIYAVYFVKSDIKEDIENQELDDFDINKDYSDQLFKNIFTGVDYDDYVWEKFSESLSDTIRDECQKHIEQKKEAESDMELWEA